MNRFLNISVQSLEHLAPLVLRDFDEEAENEGSIAE
jgi:hypothetical protein